MDPSVLRGALERTEWRLGIVGQRVRPHVLRRTTNVSLRRHGIDKSTRMAMIGHTSERVNRLYDYVSMDEKVAALPALAYLDLHPEPPNSAEPSNAEPSSAEPSSAEPSSAEPARGTLAPPPRR